MALMVTSGLQVHGAWTYAHIHTSQTQMRVCSEELSTLIACMSCFLSFFLVVVVECMRQGCMHVEVRGVALLLPPFYGICGSVSDAHLGLHSKHVCPPSHLPSPCGPQCCVEMLSGRIPGEPNPASWEVHFLQISGLNIKS